MGVGIPLSHLFAGDDEHGSEGLVMCMFKIEGRCIYSPSIRVYLKHAHGPLKHVY